MLRIKELNLTCMINDSERITEKLGQCGVGLKVFNSILFVIENLPIWIAFLMSRDWKLVMKNKGEWIIKFRAENPDVDLLRGNSGSLELEVILFQVILIQVILFQVWNLRKSRLCFKIDFSKKLYRVRSTFCCKNRCMEMEPAIIPCN